MKIRQLRVGNTWICQGHRRYVATTPFPVGRGLYAFDTHLGGPGGPVEHHRMPGDELAHAEVAR